MRNSTAKFDPTKGSNSAAPKNIQLKDDDDNKIQKNGENLLLDYHGTGDLTSGTRLKLTFEGLALTSADEKEPKTTPVTQPTDADFVVIQTNKCEICVNGKYLFDELTQRIGYFEFQGIVVYHAKFPIFRQTKFYTTFRR